jgi:O-antigen/teichoic acid export membrane protein
MKFISTLRPKSLLVNNVAVRGSLWTVLGYGLTQSLRFASNLILTRLLYPELFGLMALLNTFVMGLWLISDVGVGLSIIQNKRGDDPEFFNTAWTLQIIRGFVLWSLSLLLAWPLSVWYEEPRLAWLIPIVALSTILLGFNAPAVHLLHRNSEVGRVTLFEFTSQLITVAITILWAWVHPTIFALVGGNLIGLIIKLFRSHRLLPEISSRLIWNKKYAREIFSFGKWVFVSTLMTFFASQFDKLMIPKLVGFEVLGVYAIAIALADIPRIVCQKINRQVLFPIISRQSDSPRLDLRDFIEGKRFKLLMSFAILVALLAGFGDFLILGLYDENYADAAWMFPILALGVWPNVIFSAYNSSLLAVGRPIYGAWGQFLKLLYMIIMIPLGFAKLSILGVIIVIGLNDIPIYLSSAYGVLREKLAFLKQDLISTLVLLVLIYGIFQIRSLVGVSLSLPF